MRKNNLSFQELVEANKNELLKDPDALQQIEKRIEERVAKDFEESKRPLQKKTS